MEQNKVYVVTFLSQNSDNVNTTAWVRSTKEKAEELLATERQALLDEYTKDGWEIQTDLTNKFIIRNWDYSEFVELKLLERDFE